MQASPRPRRKKKRALPPPGPRPFATPAQRLWARLGQPGGGSGPKVARLFHALLALLFLVAWLSLGAQLDVLFGGRGLLPIAAALEQAGASGLGFSRIPTLFWWTGASDRALGLGVAAGVVLALLALAGIRVRLCLGLSTLLYLSYAAAGRTFLSFQWDNLLLEAGLLATLLPRDRPAPWAHALLRVLVFKLYFESGIAKWQSPLGDWQDGSAMTFYYETAPLPTFLAWHAHWLPAWWHHFESRFTLFFELCLPFAIFGPRAFRRVALAVFSAFQVLDIATANYGYFCYLSASLHVFLLDDADLLRARAFLRRRLPRVGRAMALARILRRKMRLFRWPPPLPSRPGRALGATIFALYVGLSATEAMARFGLHEMVSFTDPLRDRLSPLRLINTYHLFAQITRTRIEPTVEVSTDGHAFTEQPLRYKPGAVDRPPPFVAPHQPRLDFQLWFYGLAFRRGTPPYVTALLDRICKDRAVLDGIFAGPLPEAPEAARMGFYRYQFTTPAERAASGAYWKREWVGATPPVSCAR
jgi:hypothetical protein